MINAPHLPADRSPVQGPAQDRSQITPHRVSFSGTGAEYFRVWIVNVLLTLLTLSIYRPWARRRTLQYFHGHTLVAGSPLEFTGQLRRMLFGFLVFLALYAAYELARRTGQDRTAGLLFFGFAALWPVLWTGAMRFRLSSTRWRGVRMGFTASLREAYLANWPAFVIAAVWTGVFVIATALVAGARHPGIPRPPLPWASLLALFASGLVLSLLCVIRLEYNYRRLLVTRAQIGGQAGRWKPVYADFVKIWLATVGILLLSGLATGVLAGLLSVGSARVGHGGGSPIRAIVIGVFIGIVGLLVLTVPARAYRQARMFQLTWNNIGVSRIARFQSDLRTGAFVWLRTKNILLTLVTLGFYRPFAVVNEYAMRVNSLTMYVKGGIDQLKGELVRQQGALGDAAIDGLGLDWVGA